MSYILEALKKAELKSEKGGMPSLLSAAEATEHRRGGLLFYPLIGALLLNAGMIFWWVRPWWPKESQIAVRLPAAHPQVLAPTVEPPANTREPKRSDSIQEVPRAKEFAPPHPNVARKEGRDTSLSRPRKTQAPVAELVQPQLPPEKRVASSARVLSLSELPSTVRRSLPEFKVSGHAYSPEPGSRVARINDQILQEGQSLAPGLKVEEITPGGIVLSYQGYRFQISINTN
ncbi:MAG TPA: general secretion pathway protein GspB [Syntrophorhabdales bacterium]|nr:general secretion pathway protein GspB [Syntrophorhabdales bacterium]